MSNYPDTTTLAGKIAVMQAAMDGKKIQARLRCIPNDQWADSSFLDWSWDGVDYRIAPSPIATGHNPDGLTVDQLPAGYRLMTEAEVELGFSKKGSGELSKRFGSGIRIWNEPSRCWTESTLWLGSGSKNTYSVPIDWVDPLLPKPKRRIPWSCPDDVPGPVCWVKHPTWCDGECGLLIGLLNEGVYVGGGRELDNRFREWEWFGRHGILHSTDRKTWLPCEKEVEA